MSNLQDKSYFATPSTLYDFCSNVHAVVQKMTNSCHRKYGGMPFIIRTYQCMYVDVPSLPVSMFCMNCLNIANSCVPFLLDASSTLAGDLKQN